MSEQPNTRPDGIHSRYGTRHGATIELRIENIPDGHGGTITRARAKCGGCLDGHANDTTSHVRDWAQTHAAMCRALPQPEATT